ncbi:MAG: outer membrane beta-barrel protein [Proteobacteria bacterium]|nr:outer membrane beta-barrel protein [Pseudomonadota bacterium]
MSRYSCNTARALLAAASVSLATASWAEEHASKKPEVYLTGYLFATALSGKASAFAGMPPADVDLSFSDVVEHLDMGFMSAVEVRNGRWGFLADVMYSQVSPTGAVPGPLPLAVTLRQRSLTLQGNVLYRVHETPGVSVDLGAGLRYWKLDNEATSNAPVGPAPFTERVDWIDGVVMARVTTQLDGPWSLTFLGDVGGGGSDLTWQLLGTVNYQKNDRLALRAGYRVLSADYEDNGFVYDIRMQGPVIGLTYRF